MGLKDLFRRWSKAQDADTLARADEETRMTEPEREVDQEDYEARKDDLTIDESWAGAEAEESASDDLESS